MALAASDFKIFSSRNKFWAASSAPKSYGGPAAFYIKAAQEVEFPEPAQIKLVYPGSIPSGTDDFLRYRVRGRLPSGNVTFEDLTITSVVTQTVAYYDRFLSIEKLVKRTATSDYWQSVTADAFFGEASPRVYDNNGNGHATLLGGYEDFAIDRPVLVVINGSFGTLTFGSLDDADSNLVPNDFANPTSLVGQEVYALHKPYSGVFAPLPGVELYDKLFLVNCSSQHSLNEAAIAFEQQEQTFDVGFRYALDFAKNSDQDSNATDYTTKPIDMEFFETGTYISVPGDNPNLGVRESVGIWVETAPSLQSYHDFDLRLLLDGKVGGMGEDGPLEPDPYESNNEIGFAEIGEGEIA